MPYARGATAPARPHVPTVRLAIPIDSVNSNCATSLSSSSWCPPSGSTSRRPRHRPPARPRSCVHVIQPHRELITPTRATISTGRTTRAANSPSGSAGRRQCAPVRGVDPAQPSRSISSIVPDVPSCSSRSMCRSPHSEIRPVRQAGQRSIDASPALLQDHPHQPSDGGRELGIPVVPAGGAGLRHSASRRGDPDATPRRTKSAACRSRSTRTRVRAAPQHLMRAADRVGHPGAASNSRTDAESGRAMSMIAAPQGAPTCAIQPEPPRPSQVIRRLPSLNLRSVTV